MSHNIIFYIVAN